MTTTPARARNMQAFITQVFQKKDVRQEHEQERLMSLFSNRAELKREYEQQRRKAEQYTEKLRQQEVATLRVEQQLEKIEAMLADPVTAYQAMTFYQLRSLWAHCRRRLLRQVSELYETQTERERQSFLRDHEAQKNMSLKDVSRQLTEINHQGDELAAQMRELEERRDQLTGFWNYFRRRSLSERIAEFDSARMMIGKQVTELMSTSERHAATKPPEFPGLSTEGKRIVNVILIALAQELYLWFRKNELAELARDAFICEATDVRYGDIAECQALSRFIEERIDELALDGNLAMRTHKRAELLRRELEYRNQDDTVPESEGLAHIHIDVQNPGQYSPVKVNVLAQEYWGLYDALLPR